MKVPDFLPPSTPRPYTSLLKAQTPERMRGAVPALASFVVHGHISEYRALEFLVEAFVDHMWRDGKRKTLEKFIARAHDVLTNAIINADRVAEEIDAWEEYRAVELTTQSP